MPFKFNFYAVVPQVFLALLALFCLGISIADMATGGAGDPWSQIEVGFIDATMFWLGMVLFVLALVAPYYRRERA